MPLFGLLGFPPIFLVFVGLGFAVFAFCASAWLISDTLRTDPGPGAVKTEKHTPYTYDKKTPDFAQGLDFLRFWKGKPRKAEENTRKNLGTSGYKSLIIFSY